MKYLNFLQGKFDHEFIESSFKYLAFNQILTLTLREMCIKKNEREIAILNKYSLKLTMVNKSV